ncbi:MAG: twin-arginine translocation pathway signal [Planctomycetota bacterium]|nr:MAG: twin-arginine translocation pathway signal [Planctomycetota bacterium]
MTRFTRRDALKGLLAGTAAQTAFSTEAEAGEGGGDIPLQRVDRWHNTHDRVWLGEAFWANPMEDWRVKDGAAECLTTGGDRNVQLLTHQLRDADAPFAMSVRVEQVERKQVDGGVGFRIGIRSDIDEYRANCFAKSGVIAGVRDGRLVVAGRTAPLAEAAGSPKGWTLRLDGGPVEKGYRLTITATDASGQNLGSLSARVPRSAIAGNVAVVSNFDPKLRKGRGARYRFSDWRVGGAAFEVHPERVFGPILWTMYSLSDSRGEDGFVLKLSALTGPLGPEGSHRLRLQVERSGSWEDVAEAELDRDAWVATFRVPRWDASRSHRFRVVYRERHRDGSSTEFERSGTIRANPRGKLRIGALTCQNDYAFPYEPVAQNLLRLDPDLLYFSGDQIYESHGGYGLIRDPAEPAILCYLRKFYEFGWAFGEAMRDRPTLCIPDDHDVFQGNLWGEGGMKMKDLNAGTSSKGGYREPARMVNVVHRTCAGHHPEPYDPRPCEQGISVYYGEVVYGGVGFAIIADRQWKSGPERVNTGGGRADHVPDPDFDTSTLDKPGLQLLGERQEEFLRKWAADWRGHTMKVLLSQTVFAGVATHHGGYNGYLKADLDSGGWPQTARNRAIDVIRPSMALHINGDQHLTSLVQYGVHKQRDSNWSFCTPAIAAGYPRWWRPDEVGMPHANRPRHGLPNTGEYLDGLGNKVYVYAVGNPEVATKKHRYERAHQKGSGFGLVTIDTEARTYTIESFRFLVDATDGKPDNQFPGFPVVIHQTENRGENRLS